ncbi:MAG: 3'-phosphoadenosine 5'-phosphosulfate sulfotransferase [Pleopsidium flavum]|nr:MAG: 3'-phosphoadenosine 5'-phosphosulfate sulfotransferase [Pleopsidium flavum]
MPPESEAGAKTDEHIVNGEKEDTLQPLCAELHARVSAFLAEEAPDDRFKKVQDQTRISLGVIEEALKRYTYANASPIGLLRQALTIHADLPTPPSSFDELSLSYNGGKDCLVLLILFLVALHTHSTRPPPRLQSVYIVSAHPFAEVESFVVTSATTYHLDLARYAKPMKAAFADYLHEKRHVKAIFVGTRRTDPHGGELTFFDATDRGWPSFMRVHPVIDWHYAEIWSVSNPPCLFEKGFCELRRKDLWGADAYLCVRVVYTAFRHSVLRALRSRIYVFGGNDRYASESCIKSQYDGIGGAGKRDV